MRSFLIGLYSGLLLSALRTPLGLDLLQVAGRLPEWSMAYRAAALAIVAVGLAVGMRKAPERFSPTALLGGAAVGFTAHWILDGNSSHYLVQVVFSVLLVLLVVAAHRRGPDERPSKWRIVGAAAVALAGWLLLSQGLPGGHQEALFSAVLGLVSIVAIGVLATPERARPDAIREILETRPPSVGGLAGLVIAGAGLAWLGEGVARHVRELGGGTRLDDGLFGTVFLALALFGALAFARLFKRGSSRALGRGIFLSASGFGAWAALRVLTNISTPRGLDRFSRRFGLDLSRHGMLDLDALIAATSFVAPAFLIGTALALCRRPRELTALLVGAAAGTPLIPVLLGYEIGPGPEGGLAVLSSAHAAGLAMAGAALAAAGALFAVAAAGELDFKRRAIGAALAIGGGLFALLMPIRQIQIVGPWLQNPPEATMVLQGPEGLITVERATSGGLHVLLDRHVLCPPPELEGPDVARVHLSWALMSEAQRSSEAKVLLLGQLTLGRALALFDLGAGRIDRTASWYRAMPLLEEILFEGEPSWLGGSVLSPGEARERIASGEYDLILAPGAAGEAASLQGLDAPAETTVVVWLDAADGYGSAPVPAELQLLPLTLDLAELGFAAVRGPGLEEARARREFGAPRPHPAPTSEVATAGPLDLLSTRPERRTRLARAAFARRLAAEERTPGILAGLALHFEAQGQSSPFDPWELTVELEEEAMVRISEAAAGPAPSALTVQAARALAAVLRGKRRIEEIERFLSVPAEKHAPWPELELALAQADLEFLDPESAVKRLSQLLDSWGGNPAAWAMLAEAHGQVGSHAEAVKCLERAQELDPGSHLIEMRLAVALVRAGDPRGPEALEETLEEHPDDPELLPYVGDGPYPPPPAGYHPIDGHVHVPH